MRTILIAVAALPLLTGGCLAKTAVDVVTLPVKATGKAVDWTTTSQSEADRNYGRKMRKQEAREGAARKKAAQACKKDPSQCGQYDGYRAGYPAPQN
jgi:hypothetical protein